MKTTRYFFLTIFALANMNCRNMNDDKKFLTINYLSLDGEDELKLTNSLYPYFEISEESKVKKSLTTHFSSTSKFTNNFEKIDGNWCYEKKLEEEEGYSSYILCILEINRQRELVFSFSKSENKVQINGLSISTNDSSLYYIFHDDNLVDSISKNGYPDPDSFIKSRKYFTKQKASYNAIDEVLKTKIVLIEYNGKVLHKVESCVKLNPQVFESNSKKWWAHYSLSQEIKCN